MANAWQQVDIIAMEALMHLEDALVVTNLAAKDKTADFLTQPNGYSVGDTVRIKTRPDYEAKEFTSAISVQDIRESTRSMSIEKHYDVSVEVTSREKALDMENLSEQVIRPAVYRLAEQCDQYVASKITGAAGMYASNSLFTSASDMALARKAAHLQQLNPGGRFCLVDLDLEAVLLGQDFYNRYDARGPSNMSVFNEGFLARAMGMDFFSSINFPDWDGPATCGNGTSTTDNGGGANNLVGASVLTIDALTGQIEAGDRIAIAGVRRPLIAAAQAVATSTTVSLVDPITEIIPDGAAVTVVGSGQTITSLGGAIFDDDSIAVAMPRLDSPSDKPSFVASSNGYSIRVVQGYDMNAKKETLSLDLLIGAKAYDPRRITLLTEY